MTRNSNLKWLALILVGCGMPTTPPPAPSRVAKLALECPRHSVMAYDQTRSILNGPALPCTARIFDAANAPLEGVELHFLAEAGRLRGEKSNAEGVIEVTHEVSMPLPLDVEPALVPQTPLSDMTHTGLPVAPTWMHPAEWASVPAGVRPGGLMRSEPRRPDPIRLNTTGRIVNNPRDNLVTLVAWAEGAETFIDLNSDGVFDPTEPFDDLTEPFVDANDDGTWNAGEFFIDSNNNHLWDGKNSSWDAQTKIWVQERVLWTGVPSSEDTLPVVPGVVGQVQIFRITTPILLECPGSSPSCTSALWRKDNSYVQGMVQFYLSDPWFNVMTRLGPENGCRVEPSGSTLVTFGPVLTSFDGTADSPDGLVGSATITDVRDPSSPSTNRTRSSPPLKYFGTIICAVSDGSPQGSRDFTIGFSGLIE